MECFQTDLATRLGIRPPLPLGVAATDEFEDGYVSIDSQDEDVLHRIDERIQQQRNKVLRYYRQARFAEWRLQALERIRRQYFWSSRWSSGSIPRSSGSPRNEAGIPESASPISVGVEGNIVVFDVTAEVPAFPTGMASDWLGILPEVSPEVLTATAGGATGVSAEALQAAVAEDTVESADVSTVTGAGDTEVLAETAVLSEVLPVTAVDDAVVLAEASTAAAGDDTGVSPVEGNIFMKAFSMKLDCRERSEEEVANLGCNGFCINEHTFTLYEFLVLLKAIVPVDELPSYHWFMSDPVQQCPSSHSCVHFRGLTKGMPEIEFLAHLVTFNGHLDLEYASRAVIAVKCLRKKFPDGESFFNGIVYVTFATRLLAELAIAYWNDVVFKALGIGSLQVSAVISSGSIKANWDLNMPGAARFNADVFQFRSQISMDSRMFTRDSTIGLPAELMKLPRQYH